MSIAFFDLDKTLLAHNSGTMWIRREVREGNISRFDAARAGFHVLKYHFGFTSIEDALVKAFASFKGSAAASLRERTRRFYDEEIRSIFRRTGLEVLQEHRRKGDRIVLLTSSTNYLSECVDSDLGLDGLLCTTLAVDDSGLHTGAVEDVMCYGRGKLVKARAFAAAHGVELSDCVFYTDSFADLPVLEHVGRPVIVNPDRRLRAAAVRRAWPIVDWGGPDASALSTVASREPARAAS